MGERATGDGTLFPLFSLRFFSPYRVACLFFVHRLDFLPPQPRGRGSEQANQRTLCIQEWNGRKAACISDDIRVHGMVFKPGRDSSVIICLLYFVMAGALTYMT